jgi:hypothetical protein
VYSYIYLGYSSSSSFRHVQTHFGAHSSSSFPHFQPQIIDCWLHFHDLPMKFSWHALSITIPCSSLGSPPRFPLRTPSPVPGKPPPSQHLPSPWRPGSWRPAKAPLKDASRRSGGFFWTLQTTNFLWKLDHFVDDLPEIDITTLNILIEDQWLRNQRTYPQNAESYVMSKHPLHWWPGSINPMSW